MKKFRTSLLSACSLFVLVATSGLADSVKSVSIMTKQGLVAVPYGQIAYGEFGVTTLTFEDAETSVVKTVYKSLKGAKLEKALDQSGLSTAKQRGSPLCRGSGEIRLVFDSGSPLGSASRKMTIMCNRLIEDLEFPSVTYDSNVELNETWLRSL
jgi:hypothetical protein